MTCQSGTGTTGNCYMTMPAAVLPAAM